MPESSASLDEFDQLARTSRPDRCKFGRLADSLSEKDRADLDDHVDRPYAHPVFVKWFAARELKVSEEVVRRHRLGACCCDRV